MLVRAKFKSLLRGCDVAKDIASGRYPAFVYGNRFPPDELPVFCFHSVHPDTFEKILQFLLLNKYHSLTADECHAFLQNGKRFAKRRNILMTFDDGTGSLWTVAYPLLKKYGFKATAFIVPGVIKESDVLGRNLEDAWSGKATMKQVLERALTS